MLRKIEISHRTVVFTVFFLLSLWFVYFVRDIILELFVALLLMAVLGPLVDRFTKLRIPRGISVLLSYLLVFGIFSGVVALVIPPLVDQTGSFVTALPGYLSNIGLTRSLSQDILNELLMRLGSLPGEIIKITFSLFSNIISVLTVLVFAFYMLLARGNFDNSLGLFFGEGKRKEIASIIEAFETRLGGWARGELLLMFTVGFATFIGLSLMGIPFALPLSILAGVLEIIPFLGPVVAAIPSMIIGFGMSPLAGFGVIAMAFLIQQVENYVLVPKIMEKSVGVSPIVVLVALAIGARIAGVTGMIVSVPSVIALQILAKKYLVQE